MHSMNEYSSAIQLRSDRWSAMRGATAALARQPKAKEAEKLLADVRKLFESLAINFYLAKKRGGPLAPASVEEEAQVMQWAIWTIGHCEDSCVGLSFASFMRNPEKRAKRQAALRKAMGRPLKALDRSLCAAKCSTALAKSAGVLKLQSWSDSV